MADFAFFTLFCCGEMYFSDKEGYNGKWVKYSVCHGDDSGNDSRVHSGKYGRQKTARKIGLKFLPPQNGVFSVEEFLCAAIKGAYHKDGTDGGYSACFVSAVPRKSCLGGGFKSSQ